MNIDEELRLIAERQHGLVARHQAAAAGLTYDQLRHRLRGSDWEAVSRRVLRLVGAPRTDLQWYLAGVLDAGPGSALSDLAAAGLWELPLPAPRSLDVVRAVTAGKSSASLAKVHRPLHIPEHHLTVVHRVPCTSLARTLVDIAPELHPRRFERVADRIIGMHPRLLESLRLVASECQGQGRRTVPVLSEYFAKRPPGYVPVASGLEQRFCEILEAAGEPPMERQVDLGGHEWLGRVDFRDPPPYPVIVEINSASFHQSESDQEDDELRYAAMSAAGFVVQPIAGEVVWRQPREVLRLVRAARALARRPK